VSDDDLLTLDNVAVGYGSKIILDHVSLRIPRRCFVGVVGPNGAGKTTLLKTIIGIIPPLSGEIHLRESDDRLPVIGYVPQREMLDSIYLLSSFEVALMGASGRVGPGRRITRSEREWTLQCMRSTGVADLARQRYSELSGGQKQRLLIARALVTRPDLLVLDEPTAGLDVNASQSLMELLREIHAREGKAILMVNHDLPVVRRYAQAILWVHNGGVDYGPVAELLSRDRMAELLGIELA
jgi:ABC-type Mn2+/Zn2+ transport system ATPase subunit